jgi:hypothetical protein
VVRNCDTILIVRFRIMGHYYHWLVSSYLRYTVGIYIFYKYKVLLSFLSMVLAKFFVFRFGVTYMLDCIIKVVKFLDSR